jgi:glucose-6-phosphate dehydrogenase assembly protein OpcA
MDDTSEEMRAKIYGECHLGKSKGDTRCCEFVLLSYPFAARQFLESQLSVCLVADLPLFYWVHRFVSAHRMNDYQHLLRRSQRILIDSAVAPPDLFSFPWPNPGAVRDLVYARLLPVRQSIGQFLSAYEPAVLAAGLRSVTAVHDKAFTAEARVLLTWVRDRLAQCGVPSGVAYAVAPTDSGGESLGLTFTYDNGHRFSWHGDLPQRKAVFEADFGAGLVPMHTTVSLLEPDAALSDAMFF